MLVLRQNNLSAAVALESQCCSWKASSTAAAATAAVSADPELLWLESGLGEVGAAPTLVLSPSRSLPSAPPALLFSSLPPLPEVVAIVAPALAPILLLSPPARFRLDAATASVAAVCLALTAADESSKSCTNIIAIEEDTAKIVYLCQHWWCG